VPITPTRRPELAGGRDHQVDLDVAPGAVAVAEPDCPVVGLVVPGAVGDLGPQSQMLMQTVRLSYLLQIIENLLLVGKTPTPVGPGVEREGVQMRRDVTLSAGVDVGLPDPAHAISPVDDQQIGEAVLP